MAFQKYLGLPASGEVDGETAAWLSGMTEQARATADAGTLVEIDKQRQLLFFVVDGYTQWIFNTSTGNGQEYEEADQNTPGESIKGVSITPDGLHKVNRERVEGWWEGDLGEIYRPKYFVGGVAVHGSNSVPNYPASHGCVRVTVQAMDFIWESGIMPMSHPGLGPRRRAGVDVTELGGGRTAARRPAATTRRLGRSGRRTRSGRSRSRS